MFEHRAHLWSSSATANENWGLWKLNTQPGTRKKWSAFEREASQVSLVDECVFCKERRSSLFWKWMRIWRICVKPHCTAGSISSQQQLCGPTRITNLFATLENPIQCMFTNFRVSTAHILCENTKFRYTTSTRNQIRLSQKNCLQSIRCDNRWAHDVVG